MTTIGIIGAGHIGSQIARLAVENDYNVVISNSRGPETLSALIAELGPKARAATAVEAAKAGDIVVVSVPLKNYRKVPVEPLAGKIVIDTDNYYPERDGHIAELDNESTTTSELLQAHLPTSKVVKAFNHIYAADLTTHGQPAGAKNRRALVIAGDDKDAKARVTDSARHPRLRSAPNGRGTAPGPGGGQAVSRRLGRLRKMSGQRPTSEMRAGRPRPNAAMGRRATHALQYGLKYGKTLGS
jgi:predicted dinucleotide-binding enzyme